jgi:CheY-like chemotaxis protein/HPt (histidine-containing phosphotransfer) domain-containing protein
MVWKARPSGGVAMLPPLDLGPLHAPEAPPERPATDEPVRDVAFAQRHPMDILVVDDSEIGRKLTAQILRRLGYEPVQAASGPEALERFAEKPEGFGLVFMDLRMPGMDGCETVRHILERIGNGSKPMVIALTAEISEKERQRCLASGMADFLTKPCRPDELMAAIRRANGGANDRAHARSDVRAEGAPRRRWEDAEMLDPATVRSLRLLPGAVRPTLLEEMVESLERETPETCRLIVAARAAGDNGALRDLLHRLTGNFEVIGAIQVARLCRAASEASARGDASALDRLLDEIEARFEVVRRMLAKEVVV